VLGDLAGHVIDLITVQIKKHLIVGRNKSLVSTLKGDGIEDMDHRHHEILIVCGIFIDRT
jgi:hypothetical protein